MVLILVLLEDGLLEIHMIQSGQSWKVLILVLLEDGLLVNT